MILLSLILATFVLIWLMPSIIANSRHLKHRKAALIINITVGWIFLVWLPLIAWSLCSDTFE